MQELQGWVAVIRLEVLDFKFHKKGTPGRNQEQGAGSKSPVEAYLVIVRQKFFAVLFKSKTSFSYFWSNLPLQL